MKAGRDRPRNPFTERIIEEKPLAENFESNCDVDKDVWKAIEVVERRRRKAFDQNHWEFE